VVLSSYLPSGNSVSIIISISSSSNISWDSSVGIVTLRAGRPRGRSSIPGWGKIFFSSSHRLDQLWEIVSLRVAGLVCETDHSPPTSEEIKNCGAIPPLLLGA
jgi:hypothetical protein